MYNYFEHEKEDIKEVLQGKEYQEYLNLDKEDAYQELYDLLWTNDDITGNGKNGHYTGFDLEPMLDVEHCLCGNRDLLIDAFEDYDIKEYKRCLYEPYYCDLTIRTYLLGQCLGGALDDIYKRKAEKQREAEEATKEWIEF